VITLRLEKLTRNEVWHRVTHYFPLFRREARLNEWKWFSATLVIALMTFCVLAWYAYSTIGYGVVPLAGTFFMLYDYLQKIGSAFYTFAWKYSQTVQQYADLKSVDPIIQAAPADYGVDCCLPVDWKKLEITKLRFVYQDEERREHHLHDVAITINRNAKIALVGESGSGKSTLMSLIRGLHQPDHVEVRCDGMMLPHGIRDIASRVTLIPQEPEIFENTIAYNITLGTEQPSDEVMDDVRLAAFETVLAKLPHGLLTSTAEKGVNLSGGEKQRLALARGFFAAKRSDIILLDEPTSSVDSVNEMKIYKNIMERFVDCCVVSSIHKLHLLDFFDEVYLLEDGKVVEHGSPKALLAADTRLASLWKAYIASAR
jgi:ABC-type multidrug transport system fused ATPase/permease subunit